MACRVGAREGKKQKGVFLFGGADNAASATWGDSFHSTPNPMVCTGEIDASGSKLTLMGSYSTGEGPDWRFRTEFTLTGPNELLMEAYNIAPDDLEALAIRAEMKR